ncbi:hypothetical protein [Salinarimonas rosea]|uniref:hypothetical protein n=1 Tax=Salinarimonas rosea TaxID=552063 RepID=UPI00048EDC5D|nr:hypothetical protein [Salinarimonas rosea]
MRYGMYGHLSEREDLLEQLAWIGVDGDRAVLYATDGSVLGGPVDPVAHVKALDEAVRAGFITHEQACEQFGLDWKDVRIQQLEEQVRALELGLDYPNREVAALRRQVADLEEQIADRERRIDRVVDKALAAEREIAALRRQVADLETENGRIADRLEDAGPASAPAVSWDPFACRADVHASLDRILEAIARMTGEVICACVDETGTARIYCDPHGRIARRLLPVYGSWSTLHQILEGIVIGLTAEREAQDEARRQDAERRARRQACR